MTIGSNACGPMSTGPEKQKDLWCTPDWVIDLACDELGLQHFTIDLAASGPTYRCAQWRDRFDAIRENHDYQLESGAPQTAWLNPPYSKPLPLLRWVKFLWERGAISRAAILVRNDPSTAWHKLFDMNEHGHYVIPRPGMRILALNRRVKFIAPDSLKESSNPGTNTLILLGEKP